LISVGKAINGAYGGCGSHVQFAALKVADAMPPALAFETSTSELNSIDEHHGSWLYTLFAVGSARSPKLKDFVR